MDDIVRRRVTLPEVPDGDDELIFGEGVTYAIQIVAEALGVHPDDFSWDAATETFEGDVRAVVGNMLEARADASAALLKEAVEALTEERLENLWNAYNTGHELNGKWSHSFMSDGEWLASEIGLDPTQGWYDATEVKRLIPEAAARHPVLARIAAHTEEPKG